MAGALDRLKALMRENLDAKLARSKSPDRLLEQYMERATAVRGELREELVNARAELLLVQQRQNASEEQARKWGTRALDALRRGDEQETRAALRRQRSFEVSLEDWAEAITAHEQTVKSLEQASRTLAELLEDAELRMTSLVSRQKAARAALRVQSVLQAVGDSQSTDSERMVESVEEQEARAAAMAEVAARTVTERIAQFERGAADAEIELRLERMKRELRERGQTERE